MYENYENGDDYPVEKKVGITPGFFIGLIGSVLSFVVIFVPFAIAGKVKGSIASIARVYFFATADDWGDASCATFYKNFMCVIIALIIFAAAMYMRANIKGRPGKIFFWTVAIAIVFQLLKYDFSDRRVVPGSCERGIAFTLIWVVYALMLIGAITRKLGNK